MNVSQLARLAGTTPYAVRWYESIGVLPIARRRSNGYRTYTEQDLARVRLVITLRRLGLGPAEAGRVASLCLGGGEVDKSLEELVAAQRIGIGRQRADLDRLEGQLLDLELTLAASRARQRQSTDSPSPAAIRVLFASNYNAARGPIAEALLGRYGTDAFHVASAGAHPKPISTLAYRVLSEIGIDWSAARSHSYGEFAGQSFDYVITLSDRGRETCPAFSGGHTSLHWGLPDPSENGGTDNERLEAFRRVRNELSARLGPFIEVALQAAGNSRSVPTDH